MNVLKGKIAKMLDQEAISFSDIHIEVGSSMRVRIPRGLVPVDDDPVTHDQLLQFLGDHGAATSEEWQKLIDAGDGQHDARFTIEGTNIRAALFNCGGLGSSSSSGKHRRWGLSMRILPKEIPPFESLGMPKQFKKLLGRENGIIFITGITGSGKTTTMASGINEVNESMQHRIITLEDPLEYIHTSKKSLITQRQLGADFANFAAGVKQAMRQDPNIIVVGEVNDIHSLRGAMSAATSGHLVITSMHTVSAHETVSRVIDLYPTEEKEIIRGMFSQLLIAVVSQKLLPSVDGDRYHLAHEIMMNTDAVAACIKEGQLQRLPNEVDKQQPLMHVMNGSLARLVDEGKITMETALEASTDPENLEKFIGREFSDE